MFHTHHTTTADTPIIVTALLEEADRIIREAQVNRTYRKINRALPRSLKLNRILVCGDLIDDLASVGIEHQDMTVELHRRIFGPQRLAQLIEDADRSAR